jgi:hypothetical protein
MSAERFTIAGIEDADGEIREWIVTDSEGEYDPSSFDAEDLALEEVEILRRETAAALDERVAAALREVHAHQLLHRGW